MKTALSKLLDRRSSRRRRAPSLVVVIENQRYRTADWSPGGFRLEGVTKAFVPRAYLTGKITTPSGIRGCFVAEVMWRAEQRVGFRFIEIDPKIVLDLPV